MLFRHHQMQAQDVSPPRNRILLFASCLVFLGALVHLAIPFGGPGWYAFFGAPPRLVAMAESGSLRPVVTCIAIALVLFAVSAYGFSGAGLIRRLPLLRTGLAVIGAALTLRGLVFVPVAVWRPQLLGSLCGSCSEVNAFLLITSGLCLAMGVAYLLGAREHAQCREPTSR